MARKRIYMQSGVGATIGGRPIDGLFEVLLDEPEITCQMVRAYRNKGRQAKNGAVVIVYHPCSKAQADYVVAHPEVAKERP